MRYVIAMVTAAIAALLTSIFLSSPIAGWVVRQYTFDSPDTVASLHAAVFMAVSVTGLVAGFLLGWIGGSRWREAD
jgi:vancomycin permeability regulator SanA